MPWKAFAQAKQVRPAAEARGIDFGRRLQEERLQITSQLLQLIVHADEGFGVFSGELAKLRFGALAIHPPGNNLSVGKRNLDRGIAGNHAQPVVSQLQILNHFRTQHAGDVRSGGDAASGCDFFGDAAAADNFPALQHQRGESGSRKVSCRRQPVVAGADHDGVVALLEICRQAGIDL